MSKFYSVALFGALFLWLSVAHAESSFPHLSKTKENVRASLWYDGVNSLSKEENMQALKAKTDLNFKGTYLPSEILIPLNDLKF